MSPEARADRDLLISNILGTLLSLEKIRLWEKNPDIYSSSTAASAFTIMSRKYAPADERLKSLTEREEKMPVMLDEARKNLKNPPPIYTEVALEQIPGIIGFFQKDVPEAFAAARWINREHEIIPSLYHEALRYQDPRARKLLALLDGTRTCEELMAALGGPFAGSAGRAHLDDALRTLASKALLVR